MKQSMMGKSVKGLCFSILLLVASLGCKKQDSSLPVEGATNMSIQVTSTAFAEGEAIPTQYTCDGQNISPPLTWSEVPTNTLSLAIIMDDPDAPAGTWVHWVLYNLSPNVNNLEEGKKEDGIEGKNDFNRLGYGGPCPPRGSTHRYAIKLYALDTTLNLKPGATKAQLESQMRDHILSQGQLMGKYGR